MLKCVLIILATFCIAGLGRMRTQDESQFLCSQSFRWVLPKIDMANSVCS